MRVRVKFIYEVRQNRLLMIYCIVACIASCTVCVGYDFTIHESHYPTKS